MQNSFSITCITQWRNSIVHCINELYCIFIISIFFSSCVLQTITLQQSLALKFIKETVVQRCSVKKVFLKILQNSQGNSYA